MLPDGFELTQIISIVCPEKKLKHEMHITVNLYNTVSDLFV